MLYIGLDIDGEIEEFSTEYFDGAENRNDWTDFKTVQNLASKLTDFTDEDYLGVDHGTGRYPRYDIVKVPSVGEEVSYGFNGDSYFDGPIIRVSATGRKVTTASGRTYNRRKTSDVWVNNGCWVLSRGKHERRNPSF